MDISTEIAHLMKYGSTEEIKAYFDKKRKLQKQEDFFSFINDLIDNSPYKRAEVAQRAGLSHDYVYKLLRGDKGQFFSSNHPAHVYPISQTFIHLAHVYLQSRRLRNAKCPDRMIRQGNHILFSCEKYRGASCGKLSRTGWGAKR